jgi:hypothetical protein
MHEYPENKGRVLLGFVFVASAENPDIVTQALGIEPDSAIYDGKRHVSRRPDGTIHERMMALNNIPNQWFSWGAWKEHGSVQAQLENWCDRLEGKRQAIAYILSRKAIGLLTCACEAAKGKEASFCLPANLVKKVADTGLPLTVTFSPPFDPSELQGATRGGI